MAKNKKKSKPRKRASQRPSAQHGATGIHPFLDCVISPQPLQSAAKREPEIIGANRLSQPTPSHSPTARNGLHASQTDKQEPIHQPHAVQAFQNHFPPKTISNKPNVIHPANKTPNSAAASETIRPSKKRTHTESVPDVEARMEPKRKYRSTSAANSESLLGMQTRNPDEKTLLCETSVEKKGTMHVIVTTKEQHQTAVKCPCETDCGSYVRVGEYARYSTVGTPFCPHCRRTIGSEHGFNSYLQLVAHLNTETCRAIQAAQCETDIPKELRLPNGITARQALGPELFNKVNLPIYKVPRDGSLYFKCFTCSRKVPYVTRFLHCMKWDA